MNKSRSCKSETRQYPPDYSKAVAAAGCNCTAAGEGGLVEDIRCIPEED